ncbi:MAG TPA: hypothetical protein VIH99_06680 [Bdellovibrionota bacterium]|jgi:hypothetical protein
MGESRVTETAAVQASRLDTEGTKNFYGGVVDVARGITKLSRAEQGEETEEEGMADLASVRPSAATPVLPSSAGAPTSGPVLDAVRTLGNGVRRLETGRATVDHANEIIRREASAASMGTDSGLKTHELAFDREKLNESDNQVLNQMEETAGVPVSALVNAVNKGASGWDLYELASSAKGVNLSTADIAANVPAVPSSPLLAKPLSPTQSGVDGMDAGAKSVLGSVTPAQAQKADKRDMASTLNKASTLPADNRNAAPAWARAGLDSNNGSLAPIPRDQLFASFDSQGSRDGSGEPIDSLFSRVRKQLAKRQEELGTSEARNAR